MIKVTALILNQLYILKDVREFTLKDGKTVFVVDFPNKTFMYLPDEPNSWLHANPTTAHKMKIMANDELIGLVRTGPIALEFIDLSKK